MAPYMFMTFNNSLELSLGVRRRIGFIPHEPQHWCDDRQTLVDPRYRYTRSLHQGSCKTSTDEAPDRQCAGNGCLPMCGGQTRYVVAHENDHGNFESSVFSPKNCAFCPPISNGCRQINSESRHYKRMEMNRLSGV